jgi:hypothetical protein
MKHMKRLLSRIDSALAPTVEMFERPFTNARRRRPSRPLANSRLGPARQIARAVLAFEFAWRLLASRLPVMRVSLQAAVVHPQFYAAKEPPSQLGGTSALGSTNSTASMVAINRFLTSLTGSTRG